MAALGTWHGPDDRYLQERVSPAPALPNEENVRVRP